MIWLLLLPLMFFAPELSAGLFDPGPDDRSVYYLGTIFGNVGSIHLSDTNFNPILGRMFERFNYIILAVGLSIISYIGVVSTINTAQQGEIMGKKWSSLWIPMRAMFGLLLLVPNPGSGYCMAQTTVMWVVLQGIGAANQIWDVVLDSQAEGISIAGNMELNEGDKAALESSATHLAPEVLHAAVCLASFQKMRNESRYSRSVYDISHKLQISRSRPRVAENNGIATVTGKIDIGVRGLAPDFCGSFHIDAQANREADNLQRTSPIKKAYEIYYTKVDAITAMMQIYRPVAEAIATNQIFPDRNPANDPYKASYYNHGKEAYVSIMSRLYKPVIQDDPHDMINTAKSHGWIHAGSYYIQMSKAGAKQSLLNNARNRPTAHNIPTAGNPHNEHIDKQLGAGSTAINTLQNHLRLSDQYRGHQTVQQVNNNVKAIGYVGEQINGDVKFSENLHQIFDKIKNEFLSLLRSDEAKEFLGENPSIFDIDVDGMMARTSGDRTGNTDPIIGIAQYGATIMQYSEIAMGMGIFTHVIMTFLGTLAAMINKKSDGVASALPIDPAEMGLTMLMLVVSGLIILWLIGATLSVYIPMIPYMMFTVAAMGWIIMVLEAVIAAPILALGLIAPSEGEIGKTAGGLMIITNIFLRPSLMIFGFVIASRLIRAVVLLINFGFKETMMATAPGVNASFLGFIIVMVIYTAFIISIVNKCFALIYQFPDKVLRWMGGQPEHSDVEQVVGKVEQKTDQNIASVHGAVKGATLDRLNTAKQVFNKAKSNS